MTRICVILARAVGLEVTGRGIAREGYPIVAEGNPVGAITSGAPSPTLGHPVALGYVGPSWAEPGTTLEVEIRGRRVDARVVNTPFVKPAQAGQKLTPANRSSKPS